MNEPITELLDRMIAWRQAGRRAVMCAVIRARGSTPQNAGALMLVDETATTYGTIGGGCVEAEVRRAAHAMLSDNRTGVMTFKLDHDYGWDDGLICGGTIHVAVAPLPNEAALRDVREALAARRATHLPIDVDGGRDDDDESGPQRYRLNIPPRERLYIAGAGHVGQALARLAGPLEFDVSLFDDRADLLKRYAPANAKQVPGDIAEQLRAAPIDDGTYCVVVTRGHKHDEQALHAVVDRGARYVGMIGSRRKVKLIVDDLKELGVPAEALEAVHAPIGLPIDAVTVEEIALSIAAELVQVRRTVVPSIVDGPEPLPASGAALHY